MGDIDGRNDWSGRRVEADLDLAALGAAAGRGVDLDGLGVGQVQPGVFKRGAVLGRTDGFAGVLGVGDFGGFGFELTVTQTHGGLPAERASNARSGVGIDGFEQERAGLVVLRRGQLAFESAGQRRAALALFEREHPAEHDGHFVFGVLRMGEHRDLTPDAAAAEADFLVQEIVGARLLAILVGDGDEGRADQLGLDGVAVEAVALTHERQARVDRDGLAVGREEGGSHERAGAEFGGLGFGGAVFRVLRGDLEGDRLARAEEVAALRRNKADFREGIADHDGEGARRGAALAVGHGELDVEVAGVLERHGEFFAIAEFLVAGLELPAVAEFTAVEVARALGGERRLERGGAGRSAHGEFGDGLKVAADVGNLEQGGVGVGAPGVAVVEQVEATVRTEGRVDRTTEDRRAVVDEGLLLLALVIGVRGHERRGREGFQSLEVGVGVEARPLDERALPIPEQQGAVEVLREAVGLIVGFLPVEDRARAGGAAAFAELGPLFGDGVRPVDEGWHGGREFDEAGVVAALVERSLRVE